MTGGRDADAIEAGVKRLAPISLEELDRQAQLRRRVDNKYVVDASVAAELIDRLAGDYRALEIDGHRRFTYESVYFDTPDLRLYTDHVEGRRPRAKIRSRFYRETAACFFEIKVRLDEETVKRQREYEREHHGAITPEARQFLDEALADLADDRAPKDLAPSLSTTYDRLTLAAREGGERATLDVAVELASMEHRSVVLRDGLALIETKTEGGESRLDEELQASGCEPVSISKYRVGVGLLLADAPDDSKTRALVTAFV